MAKILQIIKGEKFVRLDQMDSSLVAIRLRMKQVGMTRVRRISDPTPGAFTLHTEDKIRLILQYDIQRDETNGRFDVLGLVDA